MESSGCSSENSEAYALRVMGDSMLPEFSDGQIVIVDPAYPLSSGAFVVVDYGGEVILGQYRVADERKRLLFLNADYAPLVLVPPYQIKGVVTQRAGRRRSERKHYSP
jgi:SOS-response transcriptional repressor LexA